MRPLIRVKQRETVRSDAGWFPAILIEDFASGQVLALVIHPEQQFVTLVAKGEWEDYPADPVPMALFKEYVDLAVAKAVGELTAPAK